jgi:drug/metabolite transporter (DMT)-like permease
MSFAAGECHRRYPMRPISIPSVHTLIGFLAILIWSTLALLTTATASVPPFAANAIAFGVAALAGGIRLVVVPGTRAALDQPLSVWAVGIAGLFGFHALYFTALRMAPPAQAGLISNLWPLFLVIGLDCLERGRVRGGTVCGGLCAFAGVCLLAVSGRDVVGFTWHNLVGYTCALASALVWAWYSLATSRMRAVPSDAVTGFCFATAIFSAMAHAVAEPAVRIDDPAVLFALIGLGLGPVGLAFFLWDHALKAGNAYAIGFASFLTPVLSTSLLVILGVSESGWSLVSACVLIALGAAVARLNRAARPRR